MAARTEDNQVDVAPANCGCGVKDTDKDGVPDNLDKCPNEPGTINGASVAQIGDSAVIAAIGQDQSLRFYWQTIGTKPWNAEQVADPNVVSVDSVPSIAQIKPVPLRVRPGQLFP